MKRRQSNRLHVGNVAIGGGAPVSVQSMTNTPTSDADATLAQIRDDLSKRFHSRIQTAVRIDPDLIGGVRIAVNDEVIDASVRGKLAAMAASLKN